MPAVLEARWIPLATVTGLIAGIPFTEIERRLPLSQESVLGGVAKPFPKEVNRWSGLKGGGLF